MKNMTAEEYIKDPSGSSSLPFWKSDTTLPDSIKVMRDDEFEESVPDIWEDDPYFKMVHRLGDTEEILLHPDFEEASCSLSEMAEHINSCYEEEGISEAELANYRMSPVYDETLWLCIKEKESDKIAASAIGEFDRKTGEGILDWIQVTEGFRGRGLGKYIVSELLRRLKGKADFVTVSGRTGNRTNPRALYKACGFGEEIIWHVLRRIK